MKTRKQSLKSLIKEADKLYQIKYIRENPYSVVSGKPTEVIHHFIYKGQSSYLRYDEKNAIPLTHQEHTQHHLSGDPAIVIKIKEAMGQEWFDDLQARRRIICKFNKKYLNEVIKELNE